MPARDADMQSVNELWLNAKLSLNDCHIQYLFDIYQGTEGVWGKTAVPNDADVMGEIGIHQYLGRSLLLPQGRVVRSREHIRVVGRIGM